MSQPTRPAARSEVRQLPPRRHEPICFQPMEEQQEDSCALLDIVVAILAAWIIVAVVIVLVAKS